MCGAAVPSDPWRVKEKVRRGRSGQPKVTCQKCRAGCANPPSQSQVLFSASPDAAESVVSPTPAVSLSLHREAGYLASSPGAFCVSVALHLLLQTVTNPHHILGILFLPVGTEHLLPGCTEVSPRCVPGVSQVCSRHVPNVSQVSLRCVPNVSQVCPRHISGVF